MASEYAACTSQVIIRRFEVSDGFVQLIGGACPRFGSGEGKLFTGRPAKARNPSRARSGTRIGDRFQRAIRNATRPFLAVIGTAHLYCSSPGSARLMSLQIVP